MTATTREILATFLKLGLTAFGGPVAHLGYFRAEIVARRRWLSEADYAELVAVSQFLPGPASSQVGFALGLYRGGPAGAAAAWAAFTLPSAVLLALFAALAPRLDHPLAAGALEGLKIVAVAIVAHALHAMAPRLAPDRPRAAIAAGAVVIVAALGPGAGQILAIAAGAAAGALFCRDLPAPEAHAARPPVSPRTGLLALALFAAGLGLALAVPQPAEPGPLAVAAAFYRAGALVFGGGHVVLPLLDSAVVAPGWLDPDAFLAGYGAAQAIPGPLFTFAAYLGAAIGTGAAALLYALLALVAIFLPGVLVLVGVLPFWDAVRRRPAARAAVAGANAAVVGVLGVALYTPVFTSAISGPPDFALALVCLVLLGVFHRPPWRVVALAALVGAALAA